MPRSATKADSTLPILTTSSSSDGALAGGARRRQRSQRKRKRSSKKSSCKDCGVQGGGGKRGPSRKRRSSAGGAKRQAPAWMKIKAQLFKRIKANHPVYSFAEVQKVISELTSAEGFVKGKGGYQEALSAALAKYQ